VLTIALMAVALAAFDQPEPECEPIAEVAGSIEALNRFWGRSIELCAAEDPGESAVAYPDENVVLANPDWLADMALVYGPSVVTGILAHEWGHMVQGSRSSLMAELHADCLAGAFMSSAGFTRAELRQFEQISLRSGDLRRSDWQHGTGDERRRAAVRGYEGYAKTGMAGIADMCPLRSRGRAWSPPHRAAAAHPARRTEPSADCAEGFGGSWAYPRGRRCSMTAAEERR
jgi:hypothetical protein